jgi:hypothetical protein
MGDVMGEMAPAVDFNVVVKNIFLKHWPNGDADIREYLSPLIAKFIQSDCADSHYLTQLDNIDPNQRMARIWEALLYNRFVDQGWSVTSADAGPDFLINNAIYVEAVVATRGNPEQNGLPETPMGRAYTRDFEGQLTRWTAAIKTKIDKHRQDIESGHACANKPFVIAVNANLVDPDPCGINGVPIVATAVLPFSHGLEKIVSAQTGEDISGPQIPFQNKISNRKGAPIATDSFLNDDYAIVSAVIGCSCFHGVGVSAEFLSQPPYFAIHNPKAKNPLPLPWLPGAIEYSASINEPGNITLECLSN